MPHPSDRPSDIPEDVWLAALWLLGPNGHVGPAAVLRKWLNDNHNYYGYWDPEDVARKFMSKRSIRNHVVAYHKRHGGGSKSC